MFVVAGLGCASPGDGTSQQSISGVGQACELAADCSAGLECEDGACKEHGGRGGDDDGDVGAACAADTDCAAGEECDDGACKPHGGDDGIDDGNHDGNDDGNDDADDDDGGVGAVCTADTDCAAGEECDDGACKQHGGVDDLTR